MYSDTPNGFKQTPKSKVFPNPLAERGETRKNEHSVT